MHRKDVLEKALKLVTEDRNETHGDPETNLGQIAALWSTYLGVDITPSQVALCNILQKISRTRSGEHNADDYYDIVGYGAIAGQLADKENTPKVGVKIGGLHGEIDSDALCSDDQTEEPLQPGMYIGKNKVVQAAVRDALQKCEFRINRYIENGQVIKNYELWYKGTRYDKFPVIEAESLDPRLRMDPWSELTEEFISGRLTLCGITYKGFLALKEYAENMGVFDQLVKQTAPETLCDCGAGLDIRDQYLEVPHAPDCRFIKQGNT